MAAGCSLVPSSRNVWQFQGTQAYPGQLSRPGYHFWVICQFNFWGDIRVEVTNEWPDN